MTPNPYESPREAPSDPPKRPRAPFWRMILMDFALYAVLAIVGGLLFFAIAVAVDPSRWWFGV